MRGRRVLGVLASALLLGACADVVGPPDVGTPSSQLAPVPDGLEEGCPPPDTPLRFPEGDLPPDPVAVRLCPAAPRVDPDGTVIRPSIQAPVDELRAGAPALADLVDALPLVGSRQDCMYDAGPEHVWWFRYADGEARAVYYMEGGCHTARVGQELRRDRGEDVAAAFAAALATQRATTQPPVGAARVEIGCSYSTPVSVLPQPMSELVAARWCVGVGPRTVRTAPVPARLLERIRTTLLGPEVDQTDECRPAPYWRSIEGVTAWGDRVSLQTPDCSVYVRTGYGRDQMFTLYAADPDVLATLEALPLGPVERFSP